MFGGQPQLRRPSHRRGQYQQAEAAASTIANSYGEGGALAQIAGPNGIDAETLARMPLADPGGLQQLELPGPGAAALDRRVRA